MALITGDIIDRGDTRTLRVTVTDIDGAPLDPAALTLTIRTPAGVSTTYTYGVDGGLVRDSEGEYSFALTFTQSGAWTYEWRSTNPSQVQGETIEVTPSPLDVAVGVDAPYFTIGEARQLSPLDDESRYPDAAIAAMRATVEQAIEHRCGVAFVPRTATEVVDGHGNRDILLRWPRPLTVSAASVDGTALTVSDLILYRDGRVRYPSYWTRGDGNVEITYTHGYETVPGEVKQAALILTRTWLVKGPVDDRTTSLSTEDGTFALSTPGLRGSSFGVPVVDAVVQAYSLNVAVA